MDERNRVSREDLLIAEQAAEWLQRMDDATPQERAAFVAWLKESPKHLREVLLAATWDEALSDMDPDRKIDVQALAASASTNVVPVQCSHSQTAHRLHGEPSWPRKAGLGLRLYATAATALVVVAGAVGVATFVQSKGEYSTDIGELRSIELQDGSLVSLASKSSVRVELTDELRNVYLKEGQALFSVAHDPHRPFRVHVANAAVQAIGTRFDVRFRNDRTDVLVAEGKVLVGERGDPASAGAQLAAAGQGVSIVADGEVSAPAPVNVADIGAWERRRLVFKDAPLAEIAAEFGRYTRTPTINVESEEAGRALYTGSFDANMPESLIRTLELDGKLAIETRQDEFIVRARPPAPAGQAR